MKTFILALITTALMCGAAAAATQQWTYERPMSSIYQILTDGSGGCAIFAIDTNSLYRIAWLNSKGTVLYETVLPPGSSSLGLASCDKSGIIYSVVSGSSYSMVYVDKKGALTTVSDPAYQILPGIFPSYYYTRASDKKGFFAMKTALAPPNISTLARYSYK